jgi:F-type H+-transporting ATPase subunit gamma
LHQFADKSLQESGECQEGPLSDSAATTQKKITGAVTLKSVVRTMKAMSASGIVQYERAASALDDYYNTVVLGLAACFNGVTAELTLPAENRSAGQKVNGAIIFGSDQGMVGQFNEATADYAIKVMSEAGTTFKIWAVGERIEEYLADAGMTSSVLFQVPNSVKAITRLVGDILLSAEGSRTRGEIDELYIFYNHHSRESVFTPVSKRLLPLDESWILELTKRPWPTKYLPEIMGAQDQTLLSLIHEFLFVSIFRACADSLASENASRLAAMQRADKNISELLEELNHLFQSIRQNAIDEELFDVISGYEVVKKPSGTMS